MSDEVRRRPWWAHVVAAVLVIGAGFLALAAFGPVYDPLSERCPGYDDEGTMAALPSPQSRLLCGDDLLSASFMALIFGAVAVLVLVTVLLWARRRLVWFVVFLVLTPVVPLSIGFAALQLPDECTQAQWDTYGSEGCERDRELR